MTYDPTDLEQGNPSAYIRPVNSTGPVAEVLELRVDPNDHDRAMQALRAGAVTGVGTHWSAGQTYAKVWAFEPEDALAAFHALRAAGVPLVPNRTAAQEVTTRYRTGDPSE